MKDVTAEQNGAGNLTFREHVLKPHAGLDSLPGYTVVVFEKLPKGGELFFKQLEAGERLKLSFWTSAQKYFAVAVNQSFLGYSFERPVTMDDGIHKFTLIFHLKYKVADPRRVAELREQDPFGRLCNEITLAIGRSCAKRRWEMIKDRFRQLEVLVVDNEKVGLRQYAATLGLDILSIVLDKRLPPEELETREAREKAERERERLQIEQGLRDVQEQLEVMRTHARSLQDIKHKFEVRATELDKQLELRGREDAIHKADQERDIGDVEHGYTRRDTELVNELELQDKENALHRQRLNREIMTKQAEAVGTIYTNIASGIQTPSEGVEAIESQVYVQKILQADNGAGRPPAEIAASANGGRVLPSGEEDLNGLLGQAITQIEQWNCTYAQKQALRSSIMHIVAEVQLDDHADGEALRQHADKLAELAKSLRLPPPQYSFLKRFWDYEQLPGYRR